RHRAHPRDHARPGSLSCLLGPLSPLARKLTEVCGYAPAARATPTSSVFRRVVGASEEMAATGLVGPVFPGPPGLGRIGAVAAVARRNLAVGQVFDLATQLLRAHQGAGVARQIDRHAHDLDQGARRRGKAVAAHQRDIVRTEQEARSRACSRLVTSRLVSPNRSATSQTGTSVPIKLPEWSTGCNFSAGAIPNGNVSSACACTTAMTSGRAAKIAAWMKRSR